MTPKSFRHSAAFGKRMEYYLIGLMLKEGLDVYVPMVDDDGIDVVVKRPNGTFVEIQIKARSKSVKFGDAALFAAMTTKPRDNYWYLFFSERMDVMWLLSSSEFETECVVNKTGKNIGKKSIWFNGKNTKAGAEHVKPQFEKYVISNFSRILNEQPK